MLKSLLLSLAAVAQVAVAHEIGHCFQYQTHCDDNNYNGWMYNWDGSPNGLLVARMGRRHHRR